MKESIAAESLSLNLTDSAVAKVKSLCASGAKALRVKVKVGGCSGKEYVFSLEESEPSAEDLVILQDGAAVFATAETLEAMNGATLDYKDALQGAGFTVENPQAESTCGCGKSFK